MLRGAGVKGNGGGGLRRHPVKKTEYVQKSFGTRQFVSENKHNHMLEGIQSTKKI